MHVSCTRSSVRPCDTATAHSSPLQRRELKLAQDVSHSWRCGCGVAVAAYVIVFGMLAEADLTFQAAQMVAPECHQDSQLRDGGQSACTTWRSTQPTTHPLASEVTAGLAQYNLPFYLQYLAMWPEYCLVAEGPGAQCMGYILGKAEGVGENWHGHVTAVTVAPEFRQAYTDWFQVMC